MLLAVAPAASAQALWGDLRLPGRVDGARQAVAVTMSTGHADAGWLLDLIRRAYSESNPAPILDATRDYIHYLDAVATGSRQWPAGVTLAAGPGRDAARKFLELLGLQVTREQNRDVVQPSGADEAQRHAAWLRANGIDLAVIAAQLNASQPAVVSVPVTTLPLPLPEYWAKRLHDDPLPLLAIVGDRTNALMYFGLVSLDDETMQFFGARPQLLDDLRGDAATFSQFGRSLHIKNGVLQVPGGEAAAEGWRRLTGEVPAQADAFIRSLLPRGDGRMMLFFDLLSHLDAAHLQFALGSSAQDEYACFRAQDPTWSVTARPFHRPRFDPSVVLALIDVASRSTALASSASTALAPWWPDVLERVAATTDWPARPQSGQDLRERPADARWLFEWIFSAHSDVDSRWQLLRFLQRVFPSAGREAVPEVADALRVVRDMPALAFALERMGVRDPALFSAVGRAAHALTISGGRHEAAAVVVRFQGALALVDEIERHRPLSEQALTDLLLSLAKAAPVQANSHRGFVAAWIGQHLLPAVGVNDLATGRVDQDAIVAFSSRADTPATRVTWEGLEYVLDRGAAVAKAAMAIREVDRLPRLDDLLALARLQDRVSKPVASLRELTAITSEMSRLESVLAALPPVNGEPPEIARDFHDAVSNVKRISKVDDLPQVEKQSDVVGRAVDALTDAVVPPLVYALAVSPSEQPPAVFAAAWQSQVVTPLELGDLRRWDRVLWQVPAFEDRIDGGRTLRGAYLGVDLAMATTLLRHATAPDPTLHAKLDDNDRLAITQALAVRPTIPFADGPAMAAVTTALRTGRDRVKAMASAAVAHADRVAVRAALSGTSMDESRLNLILWSLALAPATAFDSLREAEIYELGTTDRLPPSWGGLVTATDGAWCLATFADQGEILRQHGFGMAPTALPDLPLRLAEHLASLGLPIGLVPYVLPAATQDWIDHVVQDGPEDWQALAAWPAHLTQSRMDDYLLQLVSIGVMAPPHAPASRFEGPPR